MIDFDEGLLCSYLSFTFTYNKGKNNYNKCIYYRGNIRYLSLGFHWSNQCPQCSVAINIYKYRFKNVSYKFKQFITSLTSKEFPTFTVNMDYIKKVFLCTPIQLTTCFQAILTHFVLHILNLLVEVNTKLAKWHFPVVVFNLGRFWDSGDVYTFGRYMDLSVIISVTLFLILSSTICMTIKQRFGNWVRMYSSWSFWF